jgi:quinate/shikimate dehydrogenase (NAD+)
MVDVESFGTFPGHLRALCFVPEPSFAQRKRFLTGLLGAPIAHSASPAMHERAAEALGLDYHYHLMEIADADMAGLRTILDAIRRLGFAGTNVTFPYKEKVVTLLDELSPGAAAIGAVNTVAVRGGRLVGFNTDSSGFARAARPLVEPVSGPVAVVGAGGVGRAIAFALAELGVASIRLFDLDEAKAASLAASLSGTRATVCRTIDAALDGVAGLVNGTPVGMLSRESPVPDRLLHGGLWVADAVYSPLWTPLLLAAKAKGARVMTGRELAINQAADAFEIFTGVRPSVDKMGQAFDEVIAQRVNA